MVTADICGSIANTDMFRGLPSGVIERISGLCIERQFRKKEVLFREGARGSEMFVLIDGCVQLSKSSDDGTEVVIRTVMPGEVFAEVMLFERNVFPVTATALKSSRLIQLSRFDISGLLANEEFRSRFIANLIGRVRYLAGKILDMSSTSAEQRLIAFLKRQDISNAVHLKKKDIAAEIGAKPETLSRLLLKLRKRRAISVKNGKITLNRT